MRPIEDDKPLQRPDAADGENPGNERAPVRPDQRHGMRPRGVDQTRGIPGELLDPIVLALRRTAGAAIAALVDGPHAIAEPGQGRDLIVPAYRMLRKPMQKKREPLAFARLEDLEIKPIRPNKEASRPKPAFNGLRHRGLSPAALLPN